MFRLVYDQCMNGILDDLGVGRKIAEYCFNFKKNNSFDPRFLEYFDKIYISLKTPSEFPRGTRSMNYKNPLKGKEIQSLFMVGGLALIKSTKQCNMLNGEKWEALFVHFLYGYRLRSGSFKYDKLKFYSGLSALFIGGKFIDIYIYRFL